MSEPTRGQVEASLAKAIIQFEKEHLGRGPVEARVFIIEDMILVRLRGVLTPAEINLAQTADGQALVKQVRRQLLENSRALLEEIVHRVIGSRVAGLYTDINVETGERVIVFTMSEDLEERRGWGRRERERKR